MNTKEIRERYASGDRHFAHANLGGADLRGADLSGANLRDAYLSGAYLRGANLRGANLSDAYLSGASLRGADLGGADLSGADLSGADTSDAYLSGADLGGADLGNAYLRGAILSHNSHVIYACLGDYQMVVQLHGPDGCPMVYAGCRTFTVDEARTHWAEGNEAEWTVKTPEYGAKQRAMLEFLAAQIDT